LTLKPGAEDLNPNPEHFELCQMKLAAEADLKVSSRLSSNQAALEMIGLSLDQLDAKVRPRILTLNFQP
jgi:hypothetical protein